jgi:phosphohistidine phosphatase
MDLYFLRHGLAGQRGEWAGDDFQRPLTEEGKARMAHEAETISALKLAFDSIITSPLVRAYQTAEIVARRLEAMDKLITDDRLEPGCGPQQLAAILRDHADAAALLLVGHEPDFSELIEHLTGGRVECKKGSLACVRLAHADLLKGELTLLLPPKVLAL